MAKNMFDPHHTLINNSDDLDNLINSGFKDYNRAKQAKRAKFRRNVGLPTVISLAAFGTQPAVRLLDYVGLLNNMSDNAIVRTLDSYSGLTNCGSSGGSGPDIIIPPDPEIAIKTIFNATDYTSGADLSGTIRYVGNGIDTTVDIGTEVDLGTAKEGVSKDFKVIITVPNSIVVEVKCSLMI